MKDVIIIGQGPAGLSAALYTCRAKLSTAILGKGGSSLLKAEKIENYFGLKDPLSGQALLEIGKKQVTQLGAQWLEEEVLSIGFEEGCFLVDTQVQRYQARSVILATGAPRKTIKIDGLSEFEGRGVSYCAVCDGFFFRNKAVAVLGNGPYALHEAMELLPVAGSVTILTNGAAPSFDALPDGISLIQTPVQSLSGDGLLHKIHLADGKELEMQGLFIALGSAGAADLARKLGAVVNGSAVAVDENMGTNIPGFFAAGDCTGGVLQVSVSVAEGAKAAMSAIDYVRHLPKA